MHGRLDAKAELKCSKKHNELHGADTGNIWKQESDARDLPGSQIAWEPPYPEMRCENAFTGVLQKFHAPMGGSNQILRCLWSSDKVSATCPAMRSNERCVSLVQEMCHVCFCAIDCQLLKH